MNTGRYDKLALPEELLLMMGHTDLKGAIGTLLHQLFDRHSQVPAFMSGFDEATLVREHENSFGCESDNITLFSVMCGVGGAELAFRGCGVQPQNMHLLEVCPECVEQLHARFPGAHIYPYDVESKEARELALSLSGRVDIGMGAIPCQDVCHANRHREKESSSERLQAGAVAV